MDQAVTQPSRGGKLGRIVGIILVLALGVFVGRYVVPAGGPTAGSLVLSVTEDGQRRLALPTFWEAWDALHEHYIGDIDDRDLFYGAVAGMVSAVDDPYTVFTDPADSEQFRETLSGQFSGVGIEIGVRGGLVRVIAPLEGSPAQQAGVRAGDVIVAVNDEQITPNTTIDEVVQKIRGERGTEVSLTVARQEGEETTTEDITIRRDTITIESVRMERIEGDIALIELLTFNGDTDQQFTAFARQLAQNPPAGIILDVRNNPGGFLQTAVNIASQFLSPGTVVVTERGEEENVHVSKGSPLLGDVPLVVLVNNGSASASEIIAGALRDEHSSPIVGTQTFGKGSVQELITFNDGSSLRVTVAKWFTPAGVSIDEEGIEPTVVIEDDTETEEDEQLQRAIEELQGGEE